MLPYSAWIFLYIYAREILVIALQKANENENFLNASYQAQG